MIGPDPTTREERDKIFAGLERAEAARISRFDAQCRGSLDWDVPDLWDLKRRMRTQ